MRVLHTADWHFGKTLEGRDRLPEQRQFVDELCQICDDEQIDLVLMAGDVYQTVNPSAQAEELFYDALDRLSKGGQRGIVVISGNHDNPERLAAASPLAERLGITLIGLPSQPLAAHDSGDAGKVRRVAAGPSWLELAIPGCDHTAVVLALPYPSEARLKELLSATLDEQEWVSAYSGRIRQMFDHLARNFRPDTVNLAMSHLFVVGGIESDSEVQIQVGGTYAVQPDVFPGSAQYVALGHLHRPQQVRDAAVPVRYSGSPLAYSFSEVGYAKSVVVVDVQPGQPADVKEVYLTSGKPLVKWVARGGLPEVVRWVEEGRDANAWIDLELHLTSALTMEDAHMLRTIHPGFVNIRPVFAGETEVHLDAERRNVPVDELFVRFYERYKGHAPDEGLVKLFLELVAEPPSDRTPEAADSDEEVAG
jgi:exonuclease SbcD